LIKACAYQQQWQLDCQLIRNLAAASTGPEVHEQWLCLQPAGAGMLNEPMQHA
jgi:hypothetical protein